MCILIKEIDTGNTRHAGRELFGKVTTTPEVFLELNTHYRNG